MLKRTVSWWVTAAMCLSLAQPTALANEVVILDDQNDSIEVLTDGATGKDSGEQEILEQELTSDDDETLEAGENDENLDDVSSVASITELDTGTLEAESVSEVRENAGGETVTLSSEATPEATPAAVVEEKSQDADSLGISMTTQSATVSIDSEATVEAIADHVYTGKQITPLPVVKLEAGGTLKKDVDYTVEWGRNIDVGKGTVTIKGKGSYTGSITIEFNIVSARLYAVAVVTKITDQIHTGLQIRPLPVVTLKAGGTLKKDVDYTVEWGKNINVGIGTVTVKGKGNYTGSITVTFNIVKDITKLVTISAIKDREYTGSKIKPLPVVALISSGAKLVKDADYTLRWGANKNVGKGTVTIEGKGSYTGSITVEFKIVPRNILIAAKLPKISARTYNGKQQKPVPTVTLRTGGRLKRNTDYTLSWARNTDVGFGTVTIKGKGNYKGTIKVAFKINPASISSLVKVSKISKKTFNGKQHAPVPVVKLKTGGKLVRNTDYTLSWGENIKVGTGTVTIKGRNNYKGTMTVRFSIVEAAPPAVSYRTHVQDIGWQGFVSNGVMSGTSGESKRLEGIKVKLGKSAYTGGIQYRTHVQNIGWQGWRRDGAMSGTSHQSRRLEAIQLKLYGELAEHYDVYYRVHAQHIGWMAWAKNGAKAGTAGHSYRLEAIQIVLVKKGAAAPGVTYKGVTSVTTEIYRER
ncbi:MAG: Ig domain-containing protein [Atopobiaceae bacterium]|nr:Ig domain-containing protein [Atopobiaceae bacterium]